MENLMYGNNPPYIFSKKKSVPNYIIIAKNLATLSIFIFFWFKTDYSKF